MTRNRIWLGTVNVTIAQSLACTFGGEFIPVPPNDKNKLDSVRCRVKSGAF